MIGGLSLAAAIVDDAAAVPAAAAFDDEDDADKWFVMRSSRSLGVFGIWPGGNQRRGRDTAIASAGLNDFENRVGKCKETRNAEEPRTKPKPANRQTGKPANRPKNAA